MCMSVFFSSPVSQDTILGLFTLSTFTAGGSHDVDLSVQVTADDSDPVAFFHIDQSNSLLLQSQQVPPGQSPEITTSFTSGDVQSPYET